MSQFTLPAVDPMTSFYDEFFALPSTRPDFPQFPSPSPLPIPLIERQLDVPKKRKKNQLTDCEWALVNAKWSLTEAAKASHADLANQHLGGSLRSIETGRGKLKEGDGPKVKHDFDLLELKVNLFYLEHDEIRKLAQLTVPNLIHRVNVLNGELDKFVKTSRTLRKFKTVREMVEDIKQIRIRLQEYIPKDPSESVPNDDSLKRKRGEGDEGDSQRISNSLSQPIAYPQFPEILSPASAVDPMISFYNEFNAFPIPLIEGELDVIPTLEIPVEPSFIDGGVEAAAPKKRKKLSDRQKELMKARRGLTEAAKASNADWAHYQLHYSLKHINSGRNQLKESDGPEVKHSFNIQEAKVQLYYLEHDIIRKIAQLTVPKLIHRVYDLKEELDKFVKTSGSLRKTKTVGEMLDDIKQIRIRLLEFITKDLSGEVSNDDSLKRKRVEGDDGDSKSPLKRARVDE